MFELFVAGVGCAVDFHDQLSRKNGEIGNVRPDGMLTAEVVADLAQRAQMDPQDDFSLRHLAAKSLGSLTRYSLPLAHCSPFRLALATLALATSPASGGG